ncbi:HIT family protein [Candidatus Microgenomates bacterium]|nr:HIT family protein [Candidatus Microgenomates bacterium]
MKNNNCIFCQIIRGEIPCHKVYEDENCLAFLDIHPIREGHILVVPKKHTPDFYDLIDDDFVKLMLAVKKIAEKVNEELRPLKTGIMTMGFDVPHAHIHIVPMQETTDITSKVLLEEKTASPIAKELQSMAEKLKLS